jgi:hypothetical protein
VTAMEHVRYLSDTIGPRGSTTPGEAQAAQYAADVIKDVGLQPVTEPFVSARSKYHPFVLSTFVGLFCVVLFWLGNPILALLALVLQVVNLLSVLAHLCSLPGPLRWFVPRGRSQNVYACVPPAGEVRRKVVLLAHLDSNRTPLVNSSSAWLQVFRWLMPASLLCGIALIVLFAVGLANPSPVLRPLSLPPALVLLIVCLLMLQADLTPFTVGANDNASAVGVTLSLASRLAVDRLQHTAVWAVLDGCEEVSLYGADAFARSHREELRDAFWIALDSVGGAGGQPRYTESETLLLTFRSDPELLSIFDEVACAHPELGAGRLRFQTGANATDGTMLACHGLRQIAVVAPGPRGSELLQIHRATVVLEHIDAQVLSKSETLVWEVLQKIDAGVQ